MPYDMYQAPNLKPGDTAYIFDSSDDTTYLPTVRKVIIKGPCEDSMNGGYEADCPIGRIKEIHTCNTGVWRNRKQARKAARQYAQEEIKRNAEKIKQISERQAYVRYALEAGLI